MITYTTEKLFELVERYQKQAYERGKINTALVEALEASNDALKAWLHIYADTECEETEVQRYKALVKESGGTLSYLAKHFAMNKAALKQAKGGACDVGQLTSYDDMVTNWGKKGGV